MPVQYNFLTAALDCFIPPHTQPPLGHRNPIHLLCLKLWSNPPLWVFQFIAAQRRVKFYFLYIFLWEIGVVTKNKYALREALNWEKKYFLWNHFVNGGGEGSDWFPTRHWRESKKINSRVEREIQNSDLAFHNIAGNGGKHKNWDLGGGEES